MWYKKKNTYINKSFSTWWNWPNCHKRPKAVPSCWPNAEKAKTLSGPHVIREKLTSKRYRWPIELRDRERKRMLKKKERKGSKRKRKGVVSDTARCLVCFVCVWHMLGHTSYRTTYASKYTSTSVLLFYSNFFFF